MATWQGALIHVENSERLRELAERYGIALSDPAGPWVLIEVEPELGKLGPPAFARALSKELHTAVIAFFLQTSVSNERIEHWENGELVRELEYHLDGGGWIAQRGTPQPWESTYFFSDDEGTGDGENWPSNLSDEVSDDDIARYEKARSKRQAGTIMDFLMGGSIPRLCRFYGVDPERPGGYVKASSARRFPTMMIAIALLLVGAFVLGVLSR